MSLFVLDTDLLTLYYRDDPIVVRSVNARPATDLAISALTVDEQLTGWYTLTRQAHGRKRLLERTRISATPWCVWPVGTSFPTRNQQLRGSHNSRSSGSMFVS